MIIEVPLTKAELATCRIIGNLRSLIARDADIVDRQMGKQNPLDMDEDGVIGEFAFCKHFNVFFDPTAKNKGASYDCLLNGRRFDIKTTRHLNGRLLSTKKENSVIDYYALAIFTGRSILLPGYAKASELRSDKNVSNLGHGDGYAMEQKDLTKWKSVN